jgi:nitroreductase
MDAQLAIASRREVRDYLPDAVPEDVIRRILDAGRITGSGRNRQPWRFVVVQDRALLDELAQTMSRPSNAEGAPLVIVIAVGGEGMTAFDGGRAAQDMMLAAWNEGIGSCPNGILDKPRASGLLGLDAGREPLIALTLGYPARKRRPERRTPEEWIARADRLPLDELVLAWL